MSENLNNLPSIKNLIAKYSGISKWYFYTFIAAASMLCGYIFVFLVTCLIPDVQATKELDEFFIRTGIKKTGGILVLYKISPNFYGKCEVTVTTYIKDGDINKQKMTYYLLRKWFFGAWDIVKIEKENDKQGRAKIACSGLNSEPNRCGIRTV